jgi:hypothetical protein
MKPFVGIALVTGFLSGCIGADRVEEAESAAAEMGVAASPATDLAANRMAFGADPSMAGTVTLAVMAQPTPDRMLIQNAWVQVEAADPIAATVSLQQAVAESGGYVSNLQQSVDGLDRKSVTVTICVPISAFSTTMGMLESLGKVIEKRVSADDVTEEFVDVEARTRNLKATEERLRDHLTRTGKLEDIVKVEGEITRVREQIERFEGRMRFLEHRVAYSTIQVTIQESPAAEPILADTFSAAQVFSQAARSLVALGQALLVKGIWVLVWTPVWLPLALASTWGLRRYWRGPASHRHRAADSAI